MLWYQFLKEDSTSEDWHLFIASQKQSAMNKNWPTEIIFLLVIICTSKVCIKLATRFYYYTVMIKNDIIWNTSFRASYEVVGGVYFEGTFLKIVFFKPSSSTNTFPTDSVLVISIHGSKFHSPSPGFSRKVSSYRVHLQSRCHDMRYIESFSFPGSPDKLVTNYFEYLPNPGHYGR